LSCNEKTSISSMVEAPAKVTLKESGNVSAVPSFHPALFPQFAPLRSPLMAPAGAKPELWVEEASATIAGGLLDDEVTVEHDGLNVCQ